MLNLTPTPDIEERAKAWLGQLLYRIGAKLDALEVEKVTVRQELQAARDIAFLLYVQEYDLEAWADGKGEYERAIRLSQEGLIKTTDDNWRFYRLTPAGLARIQEFEANNVPK